MFLGENGFEIKLTDSYSLYVRIIVLFASVLDFENDTSN